MVNCQICKIAVTRNGLAMFEHLITSHGRELLRDPARLIRMSQDPATQRAIAGQLARQLCEAAARAFLAGPGPGQLEGKGRK